MADPEPRPPVVHRPKTVRSDDEREVVVQSLVAQVGQLKTRFAAKIERDVILRMMTDRNARPDLVSVRILDGDQDHPVLATDGSIIVRSSDLDGLSSDEQAAIGLRPLRGMQVARLRGNEPELATAITYRPNYVTAMGVVVKALCGPEPAGSVPPHRLPRGRGTPLQVAVIDTGINADTRTDAWLEGLQSEGNEDLLYPDPASDVLGIGAGHGTFVSGVIQQLAPAAELRVFNPLKLDGLGTEADVAEAMLDACEWGADIINLSLGFETDDDEEPMALADAVRAVREDYPDVLVIAAAGNTGRDRPCWPGAFDDVTAVAGLTVDMRPAPWSTHGPWVTCSTIGEGIMSTYVTGIESTLVDDPPDRFGKDAWALWSGTSFAAPQITGAVAQVAQRRGVGPKDALEQILRRRRRVAAYGKVLKLLNPADIESPVDFGPIG